MQASSQARCLQARRPQVLAARQARQPLVVVANLRPSVDPMASAPQPTQPVPGKVFTCRSKEDVMGVVNANPGKLVVLMCKSSHCKPCKRFMPTYNRLATLLSDSVLLDMIGDESAETKKYMVESQVKVTPAFQMYRDGKFLEMVTGAKLPKVLEGIQKSLKDNEQGKALTPDDVEPTTDDDN